MQHGGEMFIGGHRSCGRIKRLPERHLPVCLNLAEIRVEPTERAPDIDDARDTAGWIARRPTWCHTSLLGHDRKCTLPVRPHCHWHVKPHAESDTHIDSVSRGVICGIRLARHLETPVAPSWCCHRI